MTYDCFERDADEAFREIPWLEGGLETPRADWSRELGCPFLNTAEFEPAGVEGLLGPASALEEYCRALI